MRPSWESIGSGAPGYVYCGCGAVLQNRTVLREHWHAGHFDVADENIGDWMQRIETVLGGMLKRLDTMATAGRFQAQPKIQPGSEVRTVYVSDRGIPLVAYECGHVRPVLTVENYIKWYSMFLIHPGGSVTAVDDFKGLDYIAARLGTHWVGDHIFNPRVVVRWAALRGVDVDHVSFEVICARWIAERAGDPTDPDMADAYSYDPPEEEQSDEEQEGR